MNAARWFVHEVLHAPRAGVDAWGQPAFGAAARLRARVSWTPGEQAGGSEGRGTTTATVLTSIPLKPGDRVWLPALDMTPPPDADASDSTKARAVETCTAGSTVGGRVAFYETRF